MIDGKGDGPLDISERIASTIHSRSEAWVMEWQSRRWTVGQAGAFDKAFERALSDRIDVRETAVAIAARNRPSHCFALLSLLANARPISMLYAFQAGESLGRDISDTRFAVLVIDEQELTKPVEEAAVQSGTTIIVLRDDPSNGFRIIEPPILADEDSVHRLPAAGMEILSSGTTGLPKRLFHPVDRLFRSLDGMPVNPEGKPELVMWPLSGIGGNMALATAMITGNPFVLLEKFTPEDLADVIRRHQLKRVAFTPTMVRMFYDANISRERVASLDCIVGGAGPLDPDLQEKFEARYGIPILWGMGATEFCGTILAWTLELHQAYHKQKRGSSGRPLPGCALRIVDPDTREELPRNEIGLLVVKVDAVGPEWIVTNDLARIDEDDFVFFAGRADGAIIRGGFKIVPEKVCEALRSHPGVAEAAVVGLPDERLGEMPVAVVEARAGVSLTAGELDRHLRGLLAAPQIPVHYLFVDRLPYTASTKVALGEVRNLVRNRIKEARITASKL